MAARGRGAIIRKALEFLKKIRRRSGRGSRPGSPGGGRPHFKPAHTGPPRHPNTRPMGRQFQHETVAGHPNNPFGNRAVRRLSDVERENHRVYVDDNGIFRSARDDSVFDTRGSSTHWGGTSGDRAIFVMDGNGNFYASKYQAVGDFHHSTLANGGPVAAAGEMRVLNGRVQDFTSASGHYLPTPANMRQVTDELGRFNIGNVPIFDHLGNRLF